MNIAKLSIKDVGRIKEMSILNLYRYSLKLMKTYPSIKRDELRDVLIIEYREKKDLTNRDDIAKALESAQIGLNHLITYELKRREMLDLNTNKVDQQFHLGPNHFSLKENKYKEKDDNFEYFDTN